MTPEPPSAAATAAALARNSAVVSAGVEKVELVLVVTWNDRAATVASAFRAGALEVELAWAA